MIEIDKEVIIWNRGFIWGFVAGFGAAFVLLAIMAVTS